MAPSKPFHIAVVGGGIGGLCTAIGLLHQGISVTVYESAAAFAEIGAGGKSTYTTQKPSFHVPPVHRSQLLISTVSFGPNSRQAMFLIDPKIQTGYERRATSNGSKASSQTWFDYRLGISGVGFWPDGSKGKAGQHIATVQAPNAGQSSVHRAHFLDELVALIPNEYCHFGKRLEKVTQKPDGKVEMEFHDGSTAEADAVISCDGVKSVSRKILLGQDHPELNPTFSGKYAYRGLVPMEKAVAALGDELARNSQMYLGRHGHILTFPIEKGETMNVVAFRDKPDGKWEDERWVLPMKKEDMFRDFEWWGESAMKILGLMEKPDVWALFDHPPAPTYFKGRLCLLGDSAHASTPHQGAGAGQAIEDAYVLTSLLGQCSSAAELEQAFHAYDVVRRPRSQKVVTTSRRVGRVYEFEDEELGEDLEKTGRALEKMYDWIWQEDLVAQLERAKEVMNGEKLEL